MRSLLLSLVILTGCKPTGVKPAHELCAKAAAIYAKCESRGEATAQQWELEIDRWRGLCRATMTGETKQLLPDGLAIWSEMPESVKAGLRVQAECTAAATTCEQYAACNE